MKKEKSGRREFKDYYIGLDLGTSSLGWAVTDIDYNILKFNQKGMWGIRLFEEGKTAEDRRVNRSARRRLARRNQRIGLLQELFADSIYKVDPGFYQRLKDSHFLKKHKMDQQTNSLFNDKGFTDRDYHEKYPTISHLKLDLMESNEDFDIRLLYLAIANILKHRGHFIFEGKDLRSVRSFELALDLFLESVNAYLESEGYIDEEDFDQAKRFACKDPEKLKELLRNKEKNIIQKKKEILLLFDCKSYGQQKKALETVLQSVSGSTTNTKNLLTEAELSNLDEEVKFSFRDASFDENTDKIVDILGEKMSMIETAKALHDWALLEDILGGEESIAKADVKSYEDHKLDLKLLKKLVRRDFDRETYNEIFKARNQPDNYFAYVTGQEIEKNNKEKSNRKKCSQEDLCKYLGKKLASMRMDPKKPELDEELMKKKEDYKLIFEKIDALTLLPKQRDSKNTVIPYQLHHNDLEMILKNASRYADFLNEKDADGITTSEKILKLHSFRIPYFVGPLNDAHRGEKGINNWIEKKSNERILPWNFEKVVDLEKSAENFIKNMTNKCTYLIGADVLPKNSLIYSEFMLLNELNNLKIDGEKLPQELKEAIIKDLFEKHKKVSTKKIKDYLWKEGYKASREMAVTGIDNEIKASLSSLIDFKKILDKESLTDKDKDMIEEIIASTVIFGENKKILEQRIRNNYQDLSNDQIKQILGLNYKDWGSLSKEFLQEIEATNPETGEIRTIMQALRNTDENLMQLLGAAGGFNKAVEKFNAGKLNIMDQVDHAMLDELYISPSVKKSLWQTIKTVEEIRKITGKDPKKIFVEVQREEGEKKRTKSRKDLLIDLYKSLKTEEGRAMLKELESRDQSELNSRALYLYYTQLGRCIYSGERIELSDINNKNLYDLDHIIPRSLKKDDSLDNLVLVKKEINQRVKKDIYPVPGDIQRKMKTWWEQLLKQNMISKEKFDRLNRVTPISDSELADFINRQLVETRQSSKAAIQVLSQMFPDTDVVYSKAGNVSDFRKKFDLIKVREVNDFHHAKDAYLNIVVGNFFDTKYTKNPIRFVKDVRNQKEKYTANPDVMYNYDVKRGDTVAWIADRKGQEGTIKTVKKMMRKNNIQYTRQSFERRGGISDVMPLRKGYGQLSLKQDPRMSIENYGGYNRVSGAYFILVEHDKKKKRIKSLEMVPVYLSKEIERNPEVLDRYIAENLGLINYKIITSKVSINCLVEVDGFPAHITGRSSDSILIQNAIQLILSEDETQYIKRLVKYSDRNNLFKKVGSKNNLEIKSEKDGISKEINRKLYDRFIDKLENTKYSKKLLSQAEKLREKTDMFESLSLENQSLLLLEVLRFMQCNRVASNLKVIGGVERAGELSISKVVSNTESFKIINQSITGLFERVETII